MHLNPHNYPAARRAAEQQRQLEQDDFWRGANAIWAHVALEASQRLDRATIRLQSALKRRHRMARPCS